MEDRQAPCGGVSAWPVDVAVSIASNRGVHRLLTVLLVLLSVPGLAQQAPDLDVDAFLKEARRRLQTDEQRQFGYVYQETRHDLKLDKHGRPTTDTVQVFESYPGLPGEGRWNRLVSINGRPVAPEELEKQDRERQKDAQNYLTRRARETDKDRANQSREREKERRESDAIVDDVFRVYEIGWLGREAIDGHHTVLFSLTPRAQAVPRTREGRMLKHFAGKVWVSESEHELVRVEVEAIRTVSIGLGLLARVHEGSRLSFERRKVNGDAWLPARASYMVSGRLAMLKRLRLGATSEFSNYRTFAVETETVYSRPQ